MDKWASGFDYVECDGIEPGVHVGYFTGNATRQVTAEKSCDIAHF